MGYVRSKKKALSQVTFTLPMDMELYNKFRSFVKEQNTTLTLMYNEVVADFVKEYEKKNGEIK